MSYQSPPPGGPPQQPYGQQPYGQQPPPPPGAQYGSPYGPQYGGQYGGGYPPPPYSRWIRRVGAFLLDALFGLLVAIPWIAGLVVTSLGLEWETWTTSTSFRAEATGIEDQTMFTVGLVTMLIGFVILLWFGIWNHYIRQGRTGYTLGKGIVGIKLIKEETGRPLGGWLCFGRQILHAADSVLFCLGYLWPLWDRKRQTFADKIVASIVIDQPQPPKRR